MNPSQLQNGVNTLLWMQNESDGSWGEFKTMPGRVINTAEAVWALYISKATADLHKSLQFLESGALGINPLEAQNCDSSRDYAWVLTSLSVAGVDLRCPAIVACLEWLLNKRNSAAFGGFGSRLSRKQDSTFETAMATIGLCNYITANDESPSNKRINTGKYRKRVSHLCEVLLTLSNEAHGWGRNASHPTITAYTAYAVYALSLARSILGVRSRSRFEEYIQTGIDALITGDLDANVGELDSRPDGRPFRHFCRAWTLLSLSHNLCNQHTFTAAYSLSVDLLRTQNKQEPHDTGWNMLGGQSTTWGTALAVAALQTFLIRAESSLCYPDSRTGSPAGREAPMKTSTDVEDDTLTTLYNITSKFHQIACQLSIRHIKRPTINMKDEYDVQDLLRSLLKLYFDDVRVEEPTPTHSGRHSRMDLLLKDQQLVIECKMTRRGLSDKELGDQLSLDIVRYQARPDCKTLVFFIYDPEQRLRNAGGLSKDIERHSTKSYTIRVIVSP